ncbi:MAG: M3 family oligoendopeptidase [Candidatus Andersenbacteria bacterium]
MQSWDLSDLYSSISDYQIEKDIAEIQQSSEFFANAHRGVITNEISAKTLASILDAYSQIISSLRKLELYAGLEHATHTGIEEYGMFYQHISTKSTDSISHVLFVESDIVQLSDEKLTELIASADLLPFKHFLEKKLIQKKHYLPEDIEKILQQKSLTGRQAFIRLYEQDATKQQVMFALPGEEEKSVSVNYLLHLLHDTRRDVRKNAMLEVGKIARNTSTDTSFIYNTLIQDFASDAKLRHFDTSEQVRHAENELSQNVVDTLVSVVTSSYGLVQEYYALKKEVMGVSELFDYDKYAPLGQGERTYSYEEAQEIVLKAFGAFSPRFAEIAKLFFDNNWIDVPPRDHKRGGAFCAFGLPESHPYVFVNYHGSARDIAVLAHELGHAIQAYMARHENILQYDWSLPIAETASVFAEMILFKQRIAQENNQKLQLALLMAKIEDIFATVFRQVSMFQFERQAHSARSKKEVSAQQFHELWKAEQQAMFGDSLSVTPGQEAFWGLVPHFFHTPFYVYAYAFGQLLSLSLFSLYEKDGKGFVSIYEQFYADSGSKSPEEIVQAFGVDLHDAEFWQQGIDEIKTILEEAKSLAKK